MIKKEKNKKRKNKVKDLERIELNDDEKTEIFENNHYISLIKYKVYKGDNI